MNSSTLDMTRGRPPLLLFRFMLPLLASNLLQQMYTMADTVITSRGVGIHALAAIGATDMLRSFVQWGEMGLCEGFGVMIAILVGRGANDELRHAIQTACFLTLPVGILTGAVASAVSIPILRFLNTPDEIFPSACVYLMILYGGTVFTLLYYTGAAVLQAFGDSRTPFIGILISTGTNIVLDLLFVFGFEWGIAGAAAATVIAQALAGVFCISAVTRQAGVHLMRPSVETVRKWSEKLFRKGMPMAFQNSFIAVGGTIFQGVINQYGLDFIAAFAAVSKLYLLIEGMALAMKGAMTIYVGQNRGAERYDRIRSGIRNALLILAVSSALIAGLILLAEKPLLLMFLSADSTTKQDVLGIACHFLTNMCRMILVLYLLDFYRGTVMGLGNTLLPMCSGIGELAGRLVIGLAFTRWYGAEALFWAEPAAWFCGLIFLILSCHSIFRHL